MTIVEMRDILNKKIQEGKGEDLLIIDNLNASEPGIDKHFKIEEGTLVKSYSSDEFISDNHLKFDNEVGKGLHGEYEFEMCQEKIDNNFISRVIAILI